MIKEADEAWAEEKGIYLEEAFFVGGGERIQGMSPKRSDLLKLKPEGWREINQAKEWIGGAGEEVGGRS